MYKYKKRKEGEKERKKNEITRQNVRIEIASGKEGRGGGGREGG